MGIDIRGGEAEMMMKKYDEDESGVLELDEFSQVPGPHMHACIYMYMHAYMHVQARRGPARRERWPP